MGQPLHSIAFRSRDGSGNPARLPPLPRTGTLAFPAFAHRLQNTPLLLDVENVGAFSKTSCLGKILAHFRNLASSLRCVNFSRENISERDARHVAQQGRSGVRSCVRHVAQKGFHGVRSSATAKKSPRGWCATPKQQNHPEDGAVSGAVQVEKTDTSPLHPFRRGVWESRGNRLRVQA